MISPHSIETLAKSLKLHPETLRGILTGQRRIPFEAFTVLDRRLEALSEHGRTSDLQIEC